MDTIVKLKTNRRDYDIRETAEDSVSVKEFIEILSKYPQDSKIVFSNDNDYTFGTITFYSVRMEKIKTYEEEKEEEFLEKCEEEVYNLEDEEYKGDEELAETLSKIYGVEVRCYDTSIADGCAEDEEDNYVMKSCFTFNRNGVEFDVIVYYGDVTKIIGNIYIH